MGLFKDRVPDTGKGGYRNLEIIDAETSGLTNGTTFKAKVIFDDDATEEGTSFAKTNIADGINSEDGDKLATADLLAKNLKPRQRPNLLSDKLALCEDSTLFTNSNTTDSNDSSNAKFGKSAVKVTLSASTGLMFYDILSYMNTEKHYLISGHVKKGNLSGNGIKFRINANGDGGIFDNSFVTSTDYTRQGVVLKPSDFDTATQVYIRIDLDGLSTESGNFDGLALQEITAQEYEEGVGDINSLLAKLPFMSSKGIETYDNIISLPSEDNMSNGRVELELQGLSMEQLVSNGDFSNSTTDWQSYSTWTTLSETGQILKGTFSSNRVYFGVSDSEDWGIPSGDTVFVYCKIKGSKSANAVIKIYTNSVGGASSGSLGNKTLSTSFEEYYKKVTLTGIGNGIEIDGTDFTSGGDYIELDGNAGVFAINMTALGIDHLSESQMLELVRVGYFEGLKGTTPKVIENRGKNLFDGELELGTIDSGTGLNSASTTITRSVNYTIVEYGKNYKFSADIATPSTLIREYSTTKEYIGTKSTSSNVYTPTNSSVKFIRFVFATTDINNKVQLEEGSTATNYKPFENSIVTMPKGLTLYSVQNGTRCSYNYNSGKHVQRVNEHIVVSGDITTYFTGFTNIDVVIITKPSDHVLYNVSGLTLDYAKTNKLQGFGHIASAVDATTSEYKVYNQGTTSIGAIVPKGTYTDTADAQSNFATDYGGVWHYQLATPITTYYEPQTAIAFENGTQFKNNEIEEILIYDSGLTLESGYTPLSAVKVEKWDITNKKWNIVDLLTVTIGATTTISSATDGELYKIRYSYFGQGTGGILNYMYSFNLKDQINGLDKSIIELDDKVKRISEQINQTYTAGGVVTSFPSSIPASSSETQTIPLGMFATHGHLILDGYTDSGAIIYFGTVQNDAVCVSMFSSASSSDLEFKNRGTDGFVFAEAGLYFIVDSGYIILSHCWIDGTDLKLTWSNTDGSNPRSVSATKMRWEVFK